MRDELDEMYVYISGRWVEHQVSFTWLEDVEALHIATLYNLKVPDNRRVEVAKLINAINKQLWIGHFDIWSDKRLVIFRHSMILSGGVVPTQEQCVASLKVAVETSERYYQAFQFVIWSGKSVRDALDAALFETEGEA